MLQSKEQKMRKICAQQKCEGCWGTRKCALRDIEGRSALREEENVLWQKKKMWHEGRRKCVLRKQENVFWGNKTICFEGRKKRRKCAWFWGNYTTQTCVFSISQVVFYIKPPWVVGRWGCFPGGVCYLAGNDQNSFRVSRCAKNSCTITITILLLLSLFLEAYI